MSDTQDAPTQTARIAMLPVNKTSRMRSRTRRAHHALKATNLVACPKCGSSKLPHVACSICGYASGKVLLPRKSEES
jgi:large subunit ribosomal protein L32